MWPIQLASSRQPTRRFAAAALVPMLLAASSAIADVTIQSKSASLTAQGTDFFTFPGHQVVITAPDATNFVDNAEVKFHGHGSVNIDVSTSQNTKTQVSGDDLTVTSTQSFSILHSAGDADRQNLVSHTSSGLSIKFCTTKRSSFLFTASGQMEVPPGKGTTGAFSGHPFADAFVLATFVCDGCPQIAFQQLLIGVNVTGGANSAPPQPSGSSQGSGTIPPGCYELSTGMTADFTSPLLCKNKTGVCEPFQIPPDPNNSPPNAKGSFTLALQVSPTDTDGDKDENITWVGPDNGAFGDPMNWDPQKVPTITADESDTAIFSGGSTLDVDVAADAAAVASALAPRDTATRGTGRLRAKGVRDLIVKHFNSLILDDTSLDAASLIVGNKSRLHISGGTVIAHNARIGSGGAGTVIVDPQSFFMADRMLISEDGDGLVQVNGGGEADGTEVRVGNGKGLGTVKVDGAGSHFTTGKMSVGFHGRGELDVTNGAELDSGDAFVDEELPAAPDPGASSLTGTHCLGRSGGAGASIGGQQSGVSASWHAKTLSIGGLGCAEATARGRIVMGEQGSGDVLVGTSAAGSGQLFVVAGGSLLTSGRLVIGESGQGSLELDEDATFDASITVTGAFVVGDPLPPEGQGFVKVVGDPATDLSSLSSNSADVEHGIVTLTNGARMATATVAEIGTDAASHATINTNGALVLLDGAATDPASLALTRWQIGSALTIGVSDSTFTTGQLEVKNATVEVGSVGSPGQITIRQGGVLSSHGQLQSQMLTHGGTITNGGTIFGNVLLGGNFTSTVTGSEIVLPVGGPVIAVGAAFPHAVTTFAGGGSAGKTPPFGQGPVVFAGDADLSNTTLVLQFMNGFAPHQGDALPIFEAQGQITGTFAAVHITGLAPGASFNVDTDTGMATSLTDAVALPVVTIKAPAKLKESAKKGGKVKFTRTGATTDPMVVQYRVGGTAQNGLDYAPLSGTITIPAKKKSATLVVVPFADGLPEPPETIELEVLPGDDYAPNLTPTATITLLSTEKKPK